MTSAGDAEAVSGIAPPLARPARPYFPNLDGLRTLAWAAVFLSHAFAGLAALLRAGWTGPFTHRLLGSGALGVSFFFVLSGFLITTLMLQEVAATGRLDVRAFYARRILRIWPLYYAVLAYGFLAYPLIKRALGLDPYIEPDSPWWYVCFLSNFNVRNLTAERGAMSTNITWSVAIEEQFYVLWPLLFVACRPRRLPLALLGIIAVSWLFRYANAGNRMAAYYHTLAVISDMAVGALLAWLVFRSERFRAAVRELPRAAIGAAYVGGLLLAVYAYERVGAPVAFASHRLVFSLLFAFVIAEQCYARHSLLKMERLRAVTRLGRYTYGLYLLHPIAITVVLGAARAAHADAPTVTGYLLRGSASLLLTLLLAWLSYRFYERPFLALKTRFLR